ncbi:MAG TPA: aminoacyl-tRNA hydrolase [Turneriella sp.]|nr:aminoacyl-tRNA hydrolase [Turneriella sp.]
MAEKILVVALMNPGEKYRFTRHNAGAMALDLLFPDADFSLTKSLEAEIAEARTPNENFYLLKPQTFMNLSGRSVQKALTKFSIDLKKTIVLHDEVELAVGEVRYKFGGGHKGHNGLRSIMDILGKGDFHRIRIGVGRPQNDTRGIADYLLSFQSEKERAKKEALLPVWETALKAIHPNNA